jgi:hypothetical protein
MTAVTIDVSVVDRSNTKVTANPAYPIQSPLNIAELNSGIIDAPVNITELAFGYIISPINVAELAAGVVSAPIDISEVSAVNISAPIDIAELTPMTVAVPIDIAEVAVANISVPINIAEVAPSALSAPNAITANALDPETPPFSLRHARILYLNKLIGSSVTASAGINPSLVLIPNTADRWVITSGGFITFTLASSISIDTMAIGAHNLGSTNHSIIFQYSTTESSAFITFKQPTLTPSEDTAIMSHISSSVSARRVRIICTGSGSAFVGSIYAGIALQMQRPFFAGHSPINLSARTVRYSSVTEGGNFVGEQIRRIGFTTSAPFKNISNDWYRLYFQPFVVHARTLPFFFAWNLEQYPTDVGYCKTNEDITPSYGSLDMFNVSFDMVGFG